MQQSIVTSEDALLCYDPWVAQQVLDTGRQLAWLDGLQAILLLMIVLYLMALWARTTRLLD